MLPWKRRSLEPGNLKALKRHQRVAVRVVLPVAEDGGVGHLLLVLAVVLHGARHATAREAAVDEVGLDVHLEQHMHRRIEYE